MSVRRRLVPALGIVVLLSIPGLGSALETVESCWFQSLSVEFACVTVNVQNGNTTNCVVAPDGSSRTCTFTWWIWVSAHTWATPGRVDVTVYADCTKTDSRTFTALGVSWQVNCSRQITSPRNGCSPEFEAWADAAARSSDGLLSVTATDHHPRIQCWFPQ